MCYEAKSAFKRYIFNFKPVVEVLNNCSSKFVGPASVITQQQCGIAQELGILNFPFPIL